MAREKEPINPFYVLSGVMGVAFTITACAYGIMMLRANRGMMSAEGSDTEHPLFSLLDQHGMAILGVEVVILAIASVAAILLDHFRGKRAASEATKKENQHES
jgi:hypothetical protein